MRPISVGPGRAWIITPATRQDWYPAAVRTPGAGVALVDLEDSVPPADKQTARVQAHHFFGQDQASCILGLRMNSPITLEGARDLATIAVYTHRPDVILVPKVEAARDIEHVAGVVDTDGYAPQIWALIETPRALDHLPVIFTAPRLAGVIFGAADYAAAVGCGYGWEPLLWARSALVTSAAAAGLPAVDSPYFDLQDLEGLRRESEQAKQLGFWGKGAVHPRQAEVIDQAFAPSSQELDHARAVVAAGHGISTVGTLMTGPPFVTAAENLLAGHDDRPATQPGAGGTR